MIPCYVYVISDGEARQKIGFSESPEYRASTLANRRAGQVFTVAFTIEREKKIARAIERISHRKLKAHALGNEWFGVSVQTAIDTVTEAAGEIDSGAISLPLPRARDGTIPWEIHRASVASRNGVVSVVYLLNPHRPGTRLQER